MTHFFSERRLIRNTPSPEAAPLPESAEGGMEGERTLADDIDAKMKTVTDIATHILSLADDLESRSKTGGTSYTEAANTYRSAARDALGRVEQLKTQGGDALQKLIESLRVHHEDALTNTVSAIRLEYADVQGKEPAEKAYIAMYGKLLQQYATAYEQSYKGTGAPSWNLFPKRPSTEADFRIKSQDLNRRYGDYNDSPLRFMTSIPTNHAELARIVDGGKIPAPFQEAFGALLSLYEREIQDRK